MGLWGAGFDEFNFNIIVFGILPRMKMITNLGTIKVGVGLGVTNLAILLIKKIVKFS